MQIKKSRKISKRREEDSSLKETDELAEKTELIKKELDNIILENIDIYFKEKNIQEIQSAMECGIFLDHA